MQGPGHQLKLNKAAAGDTASLLFQTGFSGRAEMGTAGSDDFSVKVSADGSVFATALTVDRQSGIVTLPQGVTSGGFVLRDPADATKRAQFSAFRAGHRRDPQLCAARHQQRDCGAGRNAVLHWRQELLPAP